MTTKCSSDSFTPIFCQTKDVFALHVCEELLYYIILLCTVSEVLPFKMAVLETGILAMNNLTGTCLIFTSCDKQHNCHLQLTPYFYDNKTLEKYLASRPDTTELKDTVRLSKTNSDEEGMFAYKEDVNESCDNWNKNIWMKRLGA